jgi:class 3 adenylate cyclase
VQDNLRQTLLFANALHVFGPDHKVAERLETVVRKHGGTRIVAAQQLIDELPMNQRDELMQRDDSLRSQLPYEAIVA